MNSVVRPPLKTSGGQGDQYQQGAMPSYALTATQWSRLRDLASSLSPAQALWVSGYLAGIANAADGLAMPVSLAEKPADEFAEAGRAGPRKLTILYGTESGNCQALAQSLAEQTREVGLAPTVTDMADYKPRLLKTEQDLLIITSTYGEGDPPQRAAGFFEFIEGRKAPSLPDLRFAVLALGDSAYEFFCEAGKKLDRRFEELGAERLLDRADCDIDFEEPATAWRKAVVAKLGEQAGGAAKASISPLQHGVATAPASAAARSYDKQHPFQAAVIENIVLSGRGASKEIRHLEVSLSGSDLSYEPGDALGVLANNDPALVDEVMAKLALDGATPVSLKAGETTLAQALTRHVEITTATPRFLDHWAKLSAAAELARLQAVDQTEERNAFLRGHQIIDIIRRFPVPGLDAGEFVSGLRPLQPRLYSIASSLAAAPEEAHLTVSVVRYDLNGDRRSGVASGHLADRAEPEAVLPVYVHANPHFRLPQDDRPIIMIGAGTGVAPYRAFLQEREVLGNGGPSWLVFGDRNFRSDFLYQAEWQRLMKDGVLTRMDVAFSRDRGVKKYVQHRLLEKAADIFAWLEEGANIYVCGDAANMAPDVHQTLATIIETQGNLSPGAAADYLRGLQRDERYQRDVY
ncbi:assimilatory sulfite reductase (NADPH) flavoprotein subunit [Dongia soli]|uniref:Assimilatory sulfite reductase (NADPH) flavoprotein subunit n=1 Tax=Dongia soli TaxID=600628 RepID=A0ABU5EHA1_9PROT|nr:assimilatory sulfite reductase (NADPH) flavoprotein subunit [Dongia soli]MDY0884793.1 assimilatory sulfite reductase (NADPH) flavoprotein subunit [Dongia soli]